VLGIDHRFALASSIRPSATAKKSFSIASCPIFACRSFTLGPTLLPARGKYLSGFAEKLCLPLRDLVRVHVEAMGKLGERLVAFAGSQGYLRLKQR
jgi:hypothetical protein